MQTRIRTSIVLAAVLGTVLAAVAMPAVASGASPPPSAAQIRTALRTAEHSRNLWATVNICNTKRYRHNIGVRGQMPSLGFLASLELDIKIDYWSPAERAFRPSPGANKSIALGRVKTGLYQGGVRFAFPPHAGYLRGLVTFKWKLGNKELGRTTRATSYGHHDADFGDPPRFSSRACLIR